LSYSEDELREIYDSTNGHCVYCRKKLAFSNYADYGERGAWEVAHSIFPKRVWDTDKIHIPIIGVDISNYAPACPECNRSDQRGEIGIARAWNTIAGGRRGSPSAYLKKDR
jgi:hypothetical protein